jgi:replicative DNA helicase
MANTEEKVKGVEERVLALLLQNPGTVPQIRSLLKPDYFKNIPFRSIYDSVVEYIESHEVSPTPAILKELQGKKHPEQAEPYGVLIERLLAFELEPNESKQVEYYVEKLREFFTERAIKTTLSSILDNLDKENIRAASDIFAKGLPQLSDNFELGRLEKDAQKHIINQEYRSKHPELYAGIPMGFDNLDRFTGGHFRKELGVVVGGTGVGKSLMLGQVAVNVSKQGRHVVLVTIENDVHTYLNRLFSNITQIPYMQFKRNQVTTPELVEKFFNATGTLPKNSHLDIVEFPAGCSPNDIGFYLRQLPHEIDYLVIDQISNMHPNNPDDFKPESWQSFGHIALELKRLIGSIYRGKGIPCLTAMQASGGTTDKKELSTDDIAMSKQIIRHANFALYITRIEEVYTMGASKYRDARIEPFTVYPEFKYWQLLERPHQELGSPVPMEALPPSTGGSIVVGPLPETVPAAVTALPEAALPPSAGDPQPFQDEQEALHAEETPKAPEGGPVAGPTADDEL